MTTEQLLPVRTLEIAYVAVKFQRMQADMGNMWTHELMVRDDMVAAEEALRSLLVSTKLENEVASRGGEKSSW